MTPFHTKTYGAVGLLILAILIGSCDSQITDPETSIHNKAPEQIAKGAPAFEDPLGDGCLREDSKDFEEFKTSEDQPNWPTCKELREQQQIEPTFNALKAFYRATNGGKWKNTAGWNTTTAPTSMEAFRDWYGVTVEGGKLTRILLRDNQLTGTIPPEIGNLTNLEYLFLSFNDLTEIPAEIGNLTNLESLDLGGNELTGPIPPEIGNLTNLKYLELGGDRRLRPLPRLNLIRNKLTSNELRGPIPPEIGNLTNLEYLGLDSNQLTGPIPAEIGNLTNLQRLNLHFNQLTGPIPAEIGNLTNLQRLYLSDNQLRGPIPAEIGNLTNLEQLNLGAIFVGGQFGYRNGNQLTGPIPAEIGNLTNLEELRLTNNDLAGPIPPRDRKPHQP